MSARRRAGALGAVTLAAALVAAAVTAVTDIAAAANRDGNARFAAGDITRALERYEQARRARAAAEFDVNAASALHALGEYARALTGYANSRGDGRTDLKGLPLYDEGNTFFRMQRLADAQRAYEDALRIDPDDRDAKFNLEIVGRLEEEARQMSRPPAGGGAQPQSGPPAPGDPRPAGGTVQPGGRQGQDPGNGAPGPAGGSNGSAPGVGEALDDFRRAPTLEEALRVLDALRRKQHGVRGMLEQPSPYAPTKP